MPIAVTCEHCSTRLRVKDEAAGLKARCPKCKNVVQIPSISEPEPPEEEDGWGMTSEVHEAQVVSGPADDDTAEDSPEGLEPGGDPGMSPCPVCGENIRSTARYCRYCDEEFEVTGGGRGGRRSGAGGRRRHRSRMSTNESSSNDSSSESEGTIVRCDCGAAVRVPPERLGRQFACPKCQRGIALTVKGERLPVHQLSEGETGTLCQICQTRVQSGETFVGCPECQQVHHSECWAEVGGCGTYGCQQAPALDKGSSPAQRPTAAWGDEKTCPVCRKEIKSVALRCRYCKTDFETADPMNLREYRALRRKADESKQLQIVAIAVFLVSLLGCTAPMTLIVSLAYLFPRREQLQRSGPFFGILTYVTIGISVLFTILLVLGVLFQMAAG